MADFEAWLVFLILVVNVVGELQRKRTLAASRGFLAAARLSCHTCDFHPCRFVLAFSVFAYSTHAFRYLIFHTCIFHTCKFVL